MNPRELKGLRKSLEKWLQREIWGKTGCQRLVLRHVPLGAKQGNEVASWPIPDGGLPEEELDPLLAEIETSAYDDACGLGGLQRYAVFAFGKEEGKARGRFPFRMRGDEEDGNDDLLDSEPPTKQGFLAQIMRHNEALARANIMLVAQLGPHYNRTISHLSENNEKLVSKHYEILEREEQLLSMKHQRDMEARELEAVQKRKDEFFEKGLMLLPHVANKFLGKKVLPEPIDPQMMMLQQLLKSLKEEQIIALVQTLDPAQAAAFMEFYESFREKTGNGQTTK